MNKTVIPAKVRLRRIRPVADRTQSFWLLKVAIAHRAINYWIPAFAGMTACLLLTACSSTYKRESIEGSIKELAKKEYKLDVEVKETGDTIGIRYEVDNFLGEMVASDQLVWKNIEDLMLVLGRIGLSTDNPPKFLVLDVVDGGNHKTHLIFTRYVQDIQKLMAEALSRTEFLDRLLIEFEIDGKRSVFDPLEMDMVRLMMMSSETVTQEEGEKELPLPPFDLKEVSLPSFLADVVANTVRRELKEKEAKDDSFMLRQVKGIYLSKAAEPSFHFQLDVVPRDGQEALAKLVNEKLFPLVSKEAARILKSYKFDQFSLIKVVEKNSGQLITVPKG